MLLCKNVWNELRVGTQPQSGKQKVFLHGPVYLHTLFKCVDCISRTVSILGPDQSGSSST